jgi:hypothetical protein
MTITPEELAALQQKAAKADELEQRLAAVDGKKVEILDEKKQLQQQLKELQEREDARKKQELEDQGKTAELLQQERKEKEELQKLIADKDQAIQQAEEQRLKDRLRADFMAGMSGEAFAPAQLWALLQSAAQDRDGKTVVLFRGAELSPAELAAKMRSEAEYAHHFKPKGAGGMGSKPAAGSPIDVSGNPYLAGGNVTQRIMLELDNPDLAAKLKAEAANAAGKG